MSNLRAEPCVFVIFGASGDLTRHKLLPAIFNLCEDGHLPEEFAILGIARPPMQETDYRAQMREQVREVEGEPLEDDKWQNIERRLYYISGEFDDATLFERLKQKLAEIGTRHNIQRNYLFYLAVPPDLFGLVGERLAKANREYEARFGYLFIVCATGKGAEEMLAILERRLAHAPGEELRIAAEEQRKIMRLRLSKLLNLGS